MGRLSDLGKLWEFNKNGEKSLRVGNFSENCQLLEIMVLW